VPAAIDYLRTSRSSALLVRGHTFFKTWNYRISPISDELWAIAFLRPGRWFWHLRSLYFPRPLGWLHRIGIKRKTHNSILDFARRQTRLPDTLTHFYHGSYVGDDQR